MKIYFYPEANFKLNNARIHDVKDITEFFDYNHLNPDEFYICGKDGKIHPYPYESDVAAVFPRIGKGGHGKNIFTAVLGIFLTVATGGAALALSGALGIGVSTMHLLGIGLLCYGAGSYVMGNMKMPQISASADSATKESYQWNVGSLSTSRGVKGVTFGFDVIPQGELLSYRTYGNSALESVTKTERYFDRNAGYYGQYKDRTVYDHSEGSNNDRHYLEMLIGCGEGPLDSIDDIKINDTPIEDIAGYECDTRLGDNVQTAFSQTNLDSQVALISVGQTIPQKLAGSDVPLVITTPEACDSVLIACQCSSAYIFDTGSGNKNCAYIKPVIKYRPSGSTGTWTTAKTGVKEIDESLPLKIESTFYLNIEIKFPSNGTYEISLQNLSAELCYQKGAGGLSGSLPEVLPDRVVCALSCDNIACYNKIEQTYPGTALIYIKIPASQALNGGMPKVTWKQTRSSVWVWNGRIYETKPANNIAWGIYDIIAQIRRDNADNSFHNEGEDCHNLDYGKFSEFASFCFELGLTGNWFLNKLDSAWSTAMTLATSGRAYLGFRQGKTAPFWDAPTEMSQIFTVGSYHDMTGSISSKKDRGRAIEATFNDENDGFRSKTIRVEVDDFSADAEAASVTFCGLSTVEAVYKAAHYMLRRNKYLCQTVKFTASIRALICEVGDVIGVQCDITKYGVGGLIYDVINNGAKITLSEPVTLTQGTTYALLIAHEDGTLERKTPVETSGTYTQLTFSGAWTATPKKSEQYTFGVINQETKKYRVTTITKASELECEIEAVEYIPQLYVEGVAPDISYVNPNAGISSINVTENPEGVTLAWNPNPNTKYVDVYVDGVYYGRFEEGSASIPSINSTQHIELIPYNYAGQSGTSEERTIASVIPQPPTPPMPSIQYVSAGYILTFRDLPLDQHLSHIVIYEDGGEVARAFINGDTCVINLALPGGVHTVEACLVNTYTKESAQRTIVLAPPMIAGWIIDYDRIEGGNIQIKSEGAIQTSDFTSGYTGWYLDKNGDAEFNNIRARGAIKSTVFEYDEVNAIGGELLVRPGCVIAKDYVADDYVELYSDSAIDSAYAVTNLINGTSYTREATYFDDYDEYYEYEKALWALNNEVLGFSSYTPSIIEADYNVTAATAELTEAYALLNQINGTAYTMPSIGTPTWLQFIATEESYFDKTSAINDDPFAFVPMINANDSVIWVESADEIKVGDIIRTKDSLSGDFWGKVLAKNTSTAGVNLQVKCLHGEAFEWTKGQGVVSYGGPGTGGLLLDGNSPLLDCYTTGQEPWNSNDLWLRLGNIKGVNGISDDRYGIFIGKADGQFLQYDSKTGKLLIHGEMEISEGPVYDAIQRAQETADSAIGVASSANATAQSAESTASAALAFRNAVANTNYTSIKGGAVTTGVIKNSTYQEPSDQGFAQTGAAFDLDNGHIHTPYFYSNGSGAGFNGTLTTAGKIFYPDRGYLLGYMGPSATSGYHRFITIRISDYGVSTQDGVYEFTIVDESLKIKITAAIEGGEFQKGDSPYWGGKIPSNQVEFIGYRTNTLNDEIYPCYVYFVSGYLGYNWIFIGFETYSTTDTGRHALRLLERTKDIPQYYVGYSDTIPAAKTLYDKVRIPKSGATIKIQHAIYPSLDAGEPVNYISNWRAGNRFLNNRILEAFGHLTITSAVEVTIDMSVYFASTSDYTLMAFSNNSTPLFAIATKVSGNKIRLKLVNASGTIVAGQVSYHAIGIRE